MQRNEIILGRFFTDVPSAPMEILAAISVALIAVALLFQERIQLSARGVALSVVAPVQISVVESMFDVIDSKHRDDQKFFSTVRDSSFQKCLCNYGRLVGMSARLAIMAMSSTITALIMIAGASLLSLVSVVVFSVSAMFASAFLVRSNMSASSYSRKYSVKNQEARKALAVWLEAYESGGDRKKLREELRNVYLQGPGRDSRYYDLHRIFCIYQTKFTIRTAAAFALFVCLALAFIHEPKEGGLLQHLATVIVSVLLLGKAFGLLGSSVSFLTRMNLRHAELMAYRSFLSTGAIPKVEFNLDNEE